MGLAIALSLYTIILFLPIPAVFGFGLRYANIPVVLAITAIVYGAYRLQTVWSWVVGLSTVLAVFAVALSGLWSTSISNLLLLGSVIQLYDSPNYLAIAQGLLDGTDIHLGFLRPFAPFLVGTLLFITQQSIQGTTAFLVAFVAIATFLVSWEVRRTHGAFAGGVIVTGVLIYYRPYLATVMTENLGLALGCLGIALLWRSFAIERPLFAFIGFAFLTYGLLARMGAILVLPAIAVWGAYVFAPQGKRIAWSFIFYPALILIGGLGFNSWFSKQFSSDDYIPFGNYSYVLYGLLQGKDWPSARWENPQIFTNPDLSINEKVLQLYHVCFDLIRDDPLLLIRGILRAWGQFLSQGSRLLLTDFYPPHLSDPAFERFITWVLWPLLLAGLIGCLRHWRLPLNGLTLAMVFGTFLSTPLAPTWDAGLRPYAATVVAGYILLALGCWFSWRALISFTSKRSSLLARIPILSPTYGAEPGIGSASIKIALGLGVLLIALSSLVPLGVESSRPSRQVVSSGICPPNLRSQIFYYRPKSAVHLMPNEVIARSRIPSMRQQDFQGSLAMFAKTGQGFFASALKELQPGQSILGTVGMQKVVIVAETDRLPQQPGFYTGCGQLEGRIVTPAGQTLHYILHLNSLTPAPFSNAG